MFSQVLQIESCSLNFVPRTTEPSDGRGVVAPTVSALLPVASVGCPKGSLCNCFLGFGWLSCFSSRKQESLQLSKSPQVGAFVLFGKSKESKKKKKKD